MGRHSSHLHYQMSSDIFWMELIGKEYVYIGGDSENNTNGKTYKIGYVMKTK